MVRSEQLLLLSRRLSPPAAVIGKTEAAIRLSRLEGEMRTAKADIDRAKIELKNAETKVDENIFGIDLTTEQMQREGCEL